MSAAKSQHSALLLKLTLVVLGMFGFGFAMVPIYNIMCEITGLNGKTSSGIDSAALTIDADRTVAVEFVTGLNEGLNWDFRPGAERMEVHPGQVYTATFYATNNYSLPMVGQAVPSVAPSQAAAYLRKTECFCFTNQRFDANERREMPVRFYIDPRLPKDIRTLTLSYTFFDVTATARGKPHSSQTVITN